MKRNMLRIVSVAVVALGLNGAALGQDKVNVALASGGYLYVSVMVADVLGFFKNENIEPNIHNAGSGTKAMSAIAAGEAQFSVTAPPSAFRAREKGIDILTVGAAITQYASNIVVSKKFIERTGINANSTYEQKLKALKGSTIGVSTAGSGTDQIVRYLARRAGLNPDKDMTIATMGSGAAMLPALARDQIEGFSFSPPNPDVAIQKFGATMLFDFSTGQVKELDGFLYQAVLVREGWAQKNPDLVVRFLRAIQQGLDVTHSEQQHTKARDAVWAKYFKQTEKGLFDQIWINMRPAYPKTVELNEAQMARVAQFLADINQPISAEVMKTGWTNQYASKAVSSLRAGRR
ncbi:MAG TPA: ABC transporter substrate-binding protein [Burkholderiales bacterium]|nr:ABC transporter substrate-binding protein [Burkholderiales bacterium]